MKKIISFVQPNYRMGPISANTYYLPYSIGCIWAYAQLSPMVQNNFTVGEIIFRRDDVESVAQKLSQHDVVVFSTYIWNKNYNYTLAARIKELSPNCVTIFGGPEPPISKSNIFEIMPFADIVVKKEGEISFRAILEKFNGDYSGIPGLLLNHKQQSIDTGDGQRIDNLEFLPSPYLTGIFDSIIANHPEVTWAATLETNRGCPYGCTFCDWGSLTYSKVKKFNLDKIFAEIEWIAQRKCDALYIADANFGMYYEQDSVIIDQIINATKKYGNLKIFNMSWAKNKKEEIIDLVKKWVDAGLFAPALTISVQSLDSDVLANIKRTNMEMNKIESLFALCNEKGISPNTELILGLPGETVNSWRNNFWRLFDAGNHHGIDVYQAQCLENAEMNLLQRSIYKIKTTTVEGFRNDTDDTIAEGVDMVISTSTLSLEQMIESLMFVWFISTTHVEGTTSWYARFLKKYKNINYQTFYNGLENFLQSDPWFVHEQQQVRQTYQTWLETGVFDYPAISSAEKTGETLRYATKIKLQAHKRTNQFIELIGREYVRQYIDDDLLLDELIKFQQQSLVQFDQLPHYPVRDQFIYNIYGYVTENVKLTQPVSLEFDYAKNEDRNLNMLEFCSMMWYGRRRGFSFTKIKKVSNEKIRSRPSGRIHPGSVSGNKDLSWL
jgi:radical SAM superfamily enzyme YgiQ (UPF0313 family)